MIEPTGVTWSLSALFISMMITFVYFSIFWTIMYIVFFGIAQVFHTIYRFLSYEL